MSNVVNFFEIGTPDVKASTGFYGDLFGWQITPPENGYGMIEGEKGGMCDTAAIGGESWAIFYVQVDDVAAVIDKAKGMGAEVLLPLTDNGALEFAHLKDPQGSRFGVWRPKG